MSRLLLPWRLHSLYPYQEVEVLSTLPIIIIDTTNEESGLLQTNEIPKKIGIPKKIHIKFQKNGGKKLEFQKKIHMKFQIVRGKIGICRFFLNWSGFEPIY